MTRFLSEIEDPVDHVSHKIEGETLPLDYTALPNYSPGEGATIPKKELGRGPFSPGDLNCLEGEPRAHQVDQHSAEKCVVPSAILQERSIDPD